MEKGGKGFSLPKATPKSSMKSTAAKGSTDAKMNFSSKFGGKADTAPQKGDWGKGGKGDKTANGGKRSVSKEPQPLELRIEPELPKNSKCMMDCEAAYILQGIHDQMILLSKDPEFRMPVSFDKGLQYAKRGGNYTDAQSVRQVLETLTKYGVSDGEIAVISNVYPESVDEVFALVPSLKAKRSKLSEPLKDVLTELVKLKRSATEA